MDGNLKVILWDIDGTILNTGGAGVEPLLNAIRKCSDIKPDFDRDSFSGLTDHQIVHKLLIQNEIEATPNLIAAILNEYELHLPQALANGKITLLNEFHLFLDYLNRELNFTNAIATGNTLNGAIAKLQSVNLLSAFEFKFCSEGLKPRSDIIKNAIEYFPKNSKFCVIGDTPHDIEAAKFNNIPVIGTASGSYTTDELSKYHPDSCLIKNWEFDSLINTLKSIFK